MVHNNMYAETEMKLFRVRLMNTKNTIWINRLVSQQVMDISRSKLDIENGLTVHWTEPNLFQSIFYYWQDKHFYTPYSIQPYEFYYNVYWHVEEQRIKKLYDKDKTYRYK